MAEKFSLKIVIFISFLCGLFSACRTPIDIELFMDDPKVQVIVKATKETVDIDPYSDEKLIRGYNKISGLDPNKYYMVEKETHANGTPIPGYPKFVTELKGFIPGELFPNLEVITKIKGGTIVNLTNNNIYTVKSAKPVDNPVDNNESIKYTDSAPNGFTNMTAQVKNGVITIPKPQKKVTLDLSSVFSGKYEVMAVANPSILNNWSNGKQEFETWNAFPLEDKESTVDYVFFKKAPLDFKVLTVEIKDIEYGISLSKTGTYTFPPEVSGYTTPPLLTVTVNNIGTRPTGTLKVALSNEKSDFILNEKEINNIEVNDQKTFIISPNNGLEADKTYTDTITVSGDHGINASLIVSFRVDKEPTYKISLSQKDKHTFTAMTVGYGNQIPLSVNVTNTGNKATGSLTVNLSGTGKDNFTLSNTTLSSIGSNETTKDAFTVVPNTGLIIGIHNATVIVSGDHGINANFEVSFTVNDIDPSYSITLSLSDTHIFTAATFGYSTQTPQPVTVTNTGNRATGSLTVNLSGTGKDDFTVSPPSINSIPIFGEDVFTIVPINGLAVGSHTATVTVSGGNNITASFNVSFTVNNIDPSYSITLSLSGMHIFPAATVGYSIQSPQPVTVTNTGNRATGSLTVNLSGTGKDDFTVSPPSINNIDVSEENTFTVVPNNGLNVGIHTATVTVSGGNNITASFNVSFTVNAVSNYSILLSETGVYEFTNMTVGYPSQNARVVKITNSGEHPTGELNVMLSGENCENYFVLSTGSVGTIAVGNEKTFSVRPQDELGIGTYIATVTVSGQNGITASFGVSFTVNPAPDYNISLSVTGTYVFPAALVDYGNQNPLWVNVTNTGDQPTGTLKIALSGDNPSYFSPSKTSISSIEVGKSSSNAFSIEPRTNCPLGTHTAIVTVSNAINGISASFKVSFTVKSDNDLTVIFNIHEQAHFTTDSLSISRKDLYSGTSYNLILVAPSVPGDWSDIKWSIGGIIIDSSHITQDNVAGDTLTIDKSDTFLELLAADYFYVTVSATLNRVPYSADIKVNVGN